MFYHFHETKSVDSKMVAIACSVKAIHGFEIEESGTEPTTMGCIAS